MAVASVSLTTEVSLWQSGDYHLIVKGDVTGNSYNAGRTVALQDFIKSRLWLWTRSWINGYFETKSVICFRFILINFIASV